MPRSMPSMNDIAKSQAQQLTSDLPDLDMDIDVTAFQAGLDGEIPDMPPPLPSEFTDVLDEYLEHNVIDSNSDDEGVERSDDEETSSEFGK